jgi:hypothetical protein
VDRGNLGRQTLKEFQQFVSPVNNYKFTEEYIVQHLSSNSLDKSARVVIGTIQRIYSMLKGEKEPAPDLDDLPIESAESCSINPSRSNTTRFPHRGIRLHHHRRVSPLHLQPLAAGARILRRLAHRPHRHAVQADLRLLPAKPRHGIQP